MDDGMRRSGEYARDLFQGHKKLRLCLRCQTPILRKKDLIEVLDEKKAKSAKAAHKLLAFTAAQLDGYCSRKCRKQARRS
jgi:hypothetical protein